MHVFGSCEASAQYSPINFFVNLFHSKNSNLPHCFIDLIHTEYRKLHKNNGHSPFVSPSIMRSSVGQCRNIRFRQLSASHVIITSAYYVKNKQIIVTRVLRFTLIYILLYAHWLQFIAFRERIISIQQFVHVYFCI